jgi:hypothetical protein
LEEEALLISDLVEESLGYFELLETWAMRCIWLGVATALPSTICHGVFGEPEF